MSVLTQIQINTGSGDPVTADIGAAAENVSYENTNVKTALDNAVKKLDDLTDVTIDNTLADGQTLVYDATNQTFKNGESSSANKMDIDGNNADSEVTFEGKFNTGDDTKLAGIGARIKKTENVYQLQPGYFRIFTDGEDYFPRIPYSSNSINIPEFGIRLKTEALKSKLGVIIYSTGGASYIPSIGGQSSVQGDYITPNVTINSPLNLDDEILAYVGTTHQTSNYTFESGDDKILVRINIEFTADTQDGQNYVTFTITKLKVAVYNITTTSINQSEVSSRFNSIINSYHIGKEIDISSILGPTSTYGADGRLVYSTGNGVELLNGSATGINSFASGSNGNIVSLIGNWAGKRGSASKGIIASGEGSHAEGKAFFGYNITASGEGSHAEGYASEKGIVASGNGSHAEGVGTCASGTGSHAEGNLTKAIGSYSHAEGAGTCASGSYSHAEGSNTTASGGYSHAGGYNTVATNNYSTAIGYNGKTENKSECSYAGVGWTNSDHDNIFAVGGETQVSSPDWTRFNHNNQLLLDNAGNMFLNGAIYKTRGAMGGTLVADGRHITLEDGACYMLYINGRVMSTGAWRGMHAYFISATFNPNGTGTSTTAQAVPSIASCGSAGTVACKLEATTEAYTTSSGTRYHSRLGIGSCTTNVWIRWTLVKVGGSVDDFDI